MGEKRKGPWLRKQDNCYYTTVGRQLIKLGTAGDPWEDIEQAFHRLHAEKDTNPLNLKFATLADDFLEWVKHRRSEGTFNWYLDYLTQFDKWLANRGQGTIKARSLTPDLVEKWVDDRYEGCSDNTRHGATRAIERVCNWAVKRRLLRHSPLVGIEKPAPIPREAVISDELFAKMLKATDQQFGDLLRFLWETGCRISEARILEAKHFDGGRFILPKVSSKGKKYNRVIYCNDAAMAIVRPLLEKHKNGPVFRNKKGEPWSKSRINSRFYRFRIKFELDELCATMFRHTWATRKVKEGLDLVTIATLMGHRNVSTFVNNYQHIAQDAEWLTRSANVGILLPAASATDTQPSVPA